MLHGSSFTHISAFNYLVLDLILLQRGLTTKTVHRIHTFLRSIFSVIITSIPSLYNWRATQRLLPLSSSKFSEAKLKQPNAVVCCCCQNVQQSQMDQSCLSYGLLRILWTIAQSLLLPYELLTCTWLQVIQYNLFCDCLVCTTNFEHDIVKSTMSVAIFVIGSLVCMGLEFDWSSRCVNNNPGIIA